MYGYPLQTKLNEVRAMKLRKIVSPDENLFMKSKVEFYRQSLSVNSLIPHLDRVNHSVALYKRAHVSVYEVPKLYDG